MRVDPPCSVLAHQRDRVGVVKEIAGHARCVAQQLAYDAGVSLGLDEHGEPWRCEDGVNERPRVVDR
ncbi:MAG TPA: hypothetical protein VH701_06595, partial [Vicinamibacterales bacterium]